MFNVIQGIVIRMFNNLCACFNPKPLILYSTEIYETKTKISKLFFVKVHFGLQSNSLKSISFIQKFLFLINNNNGESSMNVGKPSNLSNHFLKIISCIIRLFLF